MRYGQGNVRLQASLPLVLGLLPGCFRSHTAPPERDPWEGFRYASSRQELYRDIFREVLVSEKYAVRYACVRELVNSADRTVPMLTRMLHAPESSEGERDRAAYILYLIGTDETLDLVAPYYVSMLSNRDYIFNDEIDSPLGHRHGGGFFLPAEDGDSLEGVTGKRMVWVKMRCPIGVLERLGRRAVPHLVRALLG
ncbi:MAG: hypothetical protein ACYTFI_01390, partial [Planctomycetota bacterium]